MSRPRIVQCCMCHAVESRGRWIPHSRFVMGEVMVHTVCPACRETVRVTLPRVLLCARAERTAG